MKKTLIAMAVLAASGASFAQATISGNVTYGYQQSNLGVGSANVAVGTPTGLSSGLGVDTTDLNFSAKEDLGGGMSADALIQFNGVNRGGVTGGDTVLGLNVSKDSRIALATARSAEYLSGGLGGVAGIGWDGRLFGARTSRDTATFTTMIVPSFKLTVSAQEAANSAAPLGLGVGAAGAAPTVAQRLFVLGGDYTAGALAAQLQWLVSDNRTDNSPASARDTIRTALTYDFGVAKVGASYVQTNLLLNNTIKDAQVGVAVPFGKTTLGASWAQRKIDGTGVATDGSTNGLGFTIGYALSKRTSISATMRSWDSKAVASEKNDDAAVLVSHSF
jgi:hypothetical protein